jgi:hypothetical protein
MQYLTVANRRYGSEADILRGLRHVRFTPESGHRAAQQQVRLSAEAMGFDSVFLAWDFARKNQAESKSNFGRGAQGRGTEIQKIHSLRNFWCCPSELN